MLIKGGRRLNDIDILSSDPGLLDILGKTNSQPDKLSVAGKEILEDIAQVFGITIYVISHKEGNLIALGNG